ncbi:MAG: hypothetical protein ACI4KG_03035 [Oscillospiraceae bacterium]
MSRKSSNRQKELPHRLSVSLSEKTYNELLKMAEKHGESIASVIRIALDKNLAIYLGTVRYIDKEQTDDILKVLMDISDTNNKILNNVKRIGINYNQELRLKNAEAKCQSVMKENGSDIYSQMEAKDELDKAKKDIEQTCLNKEELNDMRSGFEAAAEKIEEALWRILE